MSSPRAMVLQAAPREQSRKPQESYSPSKASCVGGKVELFSRVLRDRWQSFGNDVHRPTAEGFVK